MPDLKFSVPTPFKMLSRSPAVMLMGGFFACGQKIRFKTIVVTGRNKSALKEGNK